MSWQQVAQPLAAGWNGHAVDALAPSLIPGSAMASNGTSDDHTTSSSASLPAILAAFIPSLTSAILLLSVFVVIRKPFRRIYSPRTYIAVIPEKDRTPVSSLKRFEWLRTLRRLDDKFVLEHSSLDAYLYLRFLRTAVFICFAGVCITWPILFPVNATGGGDASELDKLGLGNVHDNKRLYAHAVVAWLFFGLILFVIARERLWLIGLRQAWYLARANASRLSSRTVLYLDPPKNVSAEDVQTAFGQEAKSQWIVTTTKPLDDAVKVRDDKVFALEDAEVSFLRHASKKITKAQAPDDAGAASREPASEVQVDSARPRQKSWYVAGDAYDVINHARKSVKEAVSKVGEKRDKYQAQQDEGKHRCAVFVEYADQPAAQRAYCSESKHRIPVPQDLTSTSRMIGVLPSEVIWKNLAMPQATRLSKKSLANVAIALLILFWSIPTSIVGTIANVNYLAGFDGLHWLNNLPKPVLGLLTGLVPPLLTSLLASYVPNIMRAVAKAAGEPTTVSAELQVQAWYYAFQVIQVFLVTALSSSATAFIPKIINEPHHVPELLADNIPSSSNFYLTYFILQGLASSVKNVMNWSDLVQYILYEMFVYKTPRDKFNQYSSLKGISWGKVYPKFTNFVIIALVYSCISPLVLGFATIGLSLFYYSYKYNLLFVVQPKMESKGKCYTRALQQILAGVYIGELCLIGLFGLRKAKGPSVLAVILFLGTIVYHVLTNRYLKPLEDHFPHDLVAQDANSSSDVDPEQQPLLSAAGTSQQQDDDDDNNPHDHSRIQGIGRRAHIPRQVLTPLAAFFEPHVYASRTEMRRFLRNTAAEMDPPPQYSDDEVRNAYQNPSFRSSAPVVWLPRDQYGLSKGEIESLAKDEIEALDAGAWVDEKGNVDFEKKDLSALPVWKKGVAY
ncbi:hypothetical protein BD289DRAFT_441297 [Coniella lustricola]|uniref:DUF221-domain-containing protein n=1 Tax=Coniella lustricola TaxID=2025994 RepID=A0A2T2ZZK7_9PEZI|nr:hypothetical protein BD289DRAFT_441297 [Coniella lustricola]